MGGRAGVDCGSFCKFCFYNNINTNNLEPSGCINCYPDHIGCDYCQNFIDRIRSKFKPLIQVMVDFKERNQLDRIHLSENDQISINGGGDLLNYPHLKELVNVLKGFDLPIHLNYTSGKPIKNSGMVKDIISCGVDSVGFSVFSTNPQIRKKWMNDKTSEESVEGIKIFGDNIDLNASAVVIPGINDENELYETCIDLEKWGAKSLSLRRFANYRNQGLIFQHKPLLEGVKPHSYKEFRQLVQKIDDEFSFRVLGYPFYDPKNKGPFLISKTENKNYLEKIKPIKCSATIITGKLAAPFLCKIFDEIDSSNLVNILSVDKEIADLIVHEDLESIDLKEVKGNVIIPAGALVQDNYAKKLLSSDGKHRKVIRGPYILSNPIKGEDEHYTMDEIIEFEIKSFNALIDKINSQYVVHKN
ncbi:MAG: methyl coenzyme M reductase-arginine methyltransferase Mmp10 [Methanobacterium sp.]